MADGTIQDNQISASSVNTPSAYASHFARLDSSQNGWGSLTAILNEWIQVAFDTPVNINGITTQGNPSNLQWVTAYKVEYSDDNGVTWKYVQDNHGKDEVSSRFKTYILETMIK